MNHYVYKITNRTTGEYYYGKRSCSSDWRDDTYMGSGTLLKAKMNAHADDDWHKEVLLLLDSEEEAFEYEAVCVGDRWDTDPLCLNLKPGGPGVPLDYWTEERRIQESERAAEQWTVDLRDAQSQLKVEYFSNPENREAQSERMKSKWADEEYRTKQLSHLTSPEALSKRGVGKKQSHSKDIFIMTRGHETREVPRCETEALCRDGWDYAPFRSCKNIHNPQLGVWTTGRHTTCTVLVRAGWSLGESHLCKKIPAKEAKRLSGLT